MVEGRLQTRSWEGRDGQKRQRTEVIGERVQFGPRAAGSPASSPPAVAENKKEDAGADAAKEDIPEINLDDGEEIDSGDIPF